MLTIGDFARHGRVSVRMLRYYDRIGLLHPAHVDPASNYRSYETGQLSRLNRIVALKDLGFTLEQVRNLLDEHVSVERVRGLLDQRRAELESSVTAHLQQLTQVETRLRAIESEGRLPTADVVVKPLTATRVVELTGTAASFSPADIGPVVRPLCDRLCDRLCGGLARGRIAPAGHLTCYYEQAAEEESGTVTVHAAMPARVPAGADLGALTVADLPGAASAATIVHHGPIDSVLSSWQALARWIDANGYRSSGFPREVYLESPDDPADWITELQEPVELSSAHQPHEPASRFSR